MVVKIMIILSNESSSFQTESYWLNVFLLWKKITIQYLETFLFYGTFFGTVQVHYVIMIK